MLGKLIRFIFQSIAVFILSTQISNAQLDDIRIVIDVSGSMVKTDPHNLRQPALRMISGLIPSGASAGVWTFGRYTNMEVKWGKVDESWRQSAASGAMAIHSRGQFTNIQSALVRASTGWEQPDPGTRRNLILLTDGQIDISKDAEKNKASRNELLTESLPQLVKSGITIHTIALSDFSDELLLKRIAYETGGSFEKASSAEQLQRIFLKMFERATLPDMVPLSDNEFDIDNSVHEMTLLVFNKNDKQTRLIDPDGNIDTFEQHSTLVNWLNDQGYDLITIDKPKPGKWKLDAAIDPDNRVMIVTDLQLVVDGIPAYMTPDRSVELKVELHNKGEKISKNSFLKFVKFYAEHKFQDKSQQLPLELKKSRELADKGIYLQTIDKPIAEGIHEIEIHADGSTFKRSKKYSVKVQWPVEVEIKDSDKRGVYYLKISPRDEYIAPQSLKIAPQLESPDGNSLPLTMIPLNNHWSGEIQALHQDGTHRLLINIQAQTHAGEDIAIDLAPYMVEGVKQLEPEVKPESSENSAAENGQLPDPSGINDASNLAPSDQPAEENDLLFNIMMISIINVVLITLGLAGYWFMKKSKKNLVSILEEDEELAGKIDD